MSQRYLQSLTVPLDAPGMRKPAAHTAEEGEDVEIETRQIVDREMRGPVDAGGGLRARLALRGGICTPEPAGAIDLRA